MLKLKLEVVEFNREDDAGNVPDEGLGSTVGPGKLVIGKTNVAFEEVDVVNGGIIEAVTEGEPVPLELIEDEIIDSDGDDTTGADEEVLDNDETSPELRVLDVGVDVDGALVDELVDVVKGNEPLVVDICDEITEVIAVV